MTIVNEDHELLSNLIHHELTRNDLTKVEIVIRPECNQKCKYCYLKQYGNESYPERFNNKTLLTNMESLMNYFIDNNYLIRRLDLFAGDLFFDNLFFEIIQPVYKYYKFLYDNHKDFIRKKHTFNTHNTHIDTSIVIPCNMSFCEDDEKIQKVKKIYYDFEKIGVKLYFSYSTDGIYAIDTREQRQLNEKFFDKVFSLCEEMGWGPHPMISYENIDVAIQNYEWFKNKMKQFNIQRKSLIPAYLEVRNDGWDEESLEKYKKFLLYFLDDIFHNFNNSNIESLFNNYFRNYSKFQNTNKYIFEDNTTTLGKFAMEHSVNNHLFCSMGNLNLCVNIGNLTLIPCHRLAYPELCGGKFITEQHKIVRLEASESLNSYLNLHYYNSKVRPKCITCNYQSICFKGCPGAEYEYNANPYTPIPSVCKLLQIKYDTIIDYYHNIGLFHYIFTNEPEYPANKIFQEILLKKQYYEYNKYLQLGSLNNVL